MLISGEGNGTPLQYFCLENPMDGGTLYLVVHGVTKSRIRLNNFTFTFHFHALEEEMATHSSVLAWRIPGTGEPGGLPSMGSHRVRHDWSDLAAAAAAVLISVCSHGYAHTHTHSFSQVVSSWALFCSPLFHLIMYCDNLSLPICVHQQHNFW